MNFLEQLKFIAEVITSIATACIVLKQLGKLYTPIKMFFKITVHAFFTGQISPNGKRIKFFKGLKLRRERNLAIIKSLSSNVEIEDALVLDKKELLNLISNSSAFHTIKSFKN